jgi:DNA-binding beta-propeller fold protein YncE
MRQVKLSTSFGNSALRALRALVGNTMSTLTLGSALSTPAGIVIDSAGVYAYICNSGNHKVYKVTLSDGTVAVLAGDGTNATTDGTGTGAQFSKPFGICIDSTDTNLYVTEYTGHVVRKIVISSGVVTTLAGGAGATGTTDDTGTAARFNAPYGIAITPNGLNLIVCDYTNHRIRQIVISSGVVTTLAGDGTGADVDGTGTEAQFYNPISIAIEPLGVYAYIGTRTGYHIRKMNLSSGEVTTIAGAGTATSRQGYNQRAGINYPVGLALDSAGEYLYIAQSQSRILRMDVERQYVEWWVGSGTQVNTDGVGLAAAVYLPLGIAITADDNDVWVITSNNQMRKIT